MVHRQFVKTQLWCRLLSLNILGAACPCRHELLVALRQSFITPDALVSVQRLVWKPGVGLHPAQVRHIDKQRMTSR